ncbi:unnamed protein product [Cochlearia groenlandica]
MDMISLLHDDLLIRILSLLTTNDVVATMVLSKRWKFLWMFTSTLVYDDYIYPYPEYKSRFSRFVDMSLVSHKAPVIETLHFILGKITKDIIVIEWKIFADKHRVLELIIEIDKIPVNVLLPWNLFSGGYRTLVTLTVSNVTLVDDNVTPPISFPSLKKLTLKSIKYPSEEFVNKLLSGCHILEELVVERCLYDNVTVYTVKSPSLKRLFLHTSSDISGSESHGFVIDAPSLKCLDTFHSQGFCVIESIMTNMVEAKIVFLYGDGWKKLKSITSLKRLNLCVPTLKDVYLKGSVFESLVHLKICTCETEWLNLLMRLLKDSPNLQTLKLEQSHSLGPEEPRPIWTKPTSVPECLSSKIEIFKWEYYEGAIEEKEAAAFILSSARSLKKATFITSDSIESDKKLEMHKELLLLCTDPLACEVKFL